MISGCVSTTDNDWYNIYGTLETGKPAEMMYGDVYQYKETTDLSETHRMAVLLPLSGNAAKAGETIRSAIELGILQNAPQNLSVSFFDTAGDVATSINEALATNPEVIIGPLFSNDAKILRASKPENLPVLSFTSDAASLGQGVMTMALMPTNSVEAIVKEIISDGSRNLLILAPDTDSGKLMAGAARSAATYYDLPVSGLFFYKEKDTGEEHTIQLVGSIEADAMAEPYPLISNESALGMALIGSSVGESKMVESVEPYEIKILNAKIANN